MATCPICGSKAKSTGNPVFPYQCSSCGWNFSPRQKTRDEFVTVRDLDDDWTLYVVTAGHAFEYMVQAPSGQTVEYSENGYGSPEAAMADALTLYRRIKGPWATL
jgi:hypothetical protein